MKVSTKGRYALRIMLDLAAHHTGEYIPVKEIGERQEIPVKYMEQIISQLGKAGYLRSQRGSGGGHKLSKPPGQYTAGDILKSIEGSLAPVACLEGESNLCQRREDCMTLPFWEGLHKVIGDYVDSVTLEQLLQNGQQESRFNI